MMLPSRGTRSFCSNLSIPLFSLSPVCQMLVSSVHPLEKEMGIGFDDEHICSVAVMNMRPNSWALAAGMAAFGGAAGYWKGEPGSDGFEFRSSTMFCESLF